MHECSERESCCPFKLFGTLCRKFPPFHSAITFCSLSQTTSFFLYCKIPTWGGATWNLAQHKKKKKKPNHTTAQNLQKLKEKKHKANTKQMCLCLMPPSPCPTRGSSNLKKSILDQTLPKAVRPSLRLAAKKMLTPPHPRPTTGVPCLELCLTGVKNGHKKIKTKKNAPKLPNMQN